MINWDLELNSPAPSKLSIEQGSTSSFKREQGIARSEKKKERKGFRRSSRQLSSDSEGEIKDTYQSISKYALHHDVLPFECEGIHPFETENMLQMMDVETEDLLLKRPLIGKKQSACEMGSLEKLPVFPPLYRLNSTLVGHTDRQMLEYLGDNVYISDIQKDHDDKRGKCIVHHSSRLESDYLFLENIGKAYMFPGSVYKCLNKLDRMVYTIKQYHLATSSPQFSVLRSQMQISNDDRTNTLAKFYLSWFQNGSIFMAYEPATFTIALLNSQKKKLTEKQIRTMLVEICESLEYLESKGMNHLNIKPTNILNCRGKFKLMDMGMTKQNIALFTLYDKRYMPAEMEYPKLVSRQDLWKVDIYSLGMVIVQNILGKNYIQSKYKERLSLKQNLQSMYQYSPSLIKILMRMISIEANLRPSFKQITGVQELKSRASVQRKYSL